MIKLWKKYLRYYKLQVILGPIFKLFEAIFELIVPLVMAKIIDVGIKNSDTTYILKKGGILLILAVVGFASTMVCQTFAAFASQGFTTRLRKDLYEHMNKLSMSEIDDFKVSSLITRINSDVNNMQQSVAMLIRLVVRAPFIVIGATIMAFMISHSLSVIFFTSGLLIFASIFIIMKICIPKNKKVQKDLDDKTTITKENLSGARVIRAFNNEEYEINRFYDATDTYTKDAKRVGLINALLNPITTTIISIATILVIKLSSNYVNLGKLSQGNVTSLANYLNQILVAIVVVANLVVTYAKASSSGARIMEVFNKKPSIISGNLDNTVETDNIITFNNVSFTYAKSSVPALSTSSFNIKNGESIGLIGSTGSGKTTIVSLISRLYDATEGEILYFDKNIKEYNSLFLHKEIITVIQKSVLFNMTLRENICCGETYTDDEIYEALKVAQAYEFVTKLPEGLDTLVNQGGKNFSGGERQRLCIARAIIRKPKILILDDSSSALDYKTESNLKKAIKSLPYKLTTFTISQKISSIESADRIMVIDKGYIEAFDNHNNLLKTSNIYKEIYLSQGGVIDEE